MAKISSKIKPDSTYSIKDNAFFAVPKPDAKDLIQKEIGDSKVPTEFLPQTKIMRWDNEVNVSLRLVQNEKSSSVVIKDDKIIWKGADVEARFYEIDDPEGKSEFDVVLLKKPLSNVVQFTLVDKGVEYFYQPFLKNQREDGTYWEERDGGIIESPEDVAGSYAIYASEEKLNYEGGKLYRCGKVGHIYRPKIYDSKGAEVWGELNIENGILSITVPQEFLDKATYPVIVDPTLGNTSIGSSSRGGYNNYVFYTARFSTDANGGTVSKIQAAVWGSDSSKYFGLAIYDSTPSSLIANSHSGSLAVTRSTKPTADEHWLSSTSVSASLSASTNYRLAYAVQNGNTNIALDFTTSNGYRKSLTYSSFPESTTSGLSSDTDSKFSAYATYTAGGGSSAPTVTTQSVSSIASTTATGNGNVTADGGATVTERGVCWGTSTNPTIAGNHSAATAGGTGVFTASITSLSAKTHYYVRAYATNSVGTSYGDNVEFDTSGDFIVADESSASSLENIELTFNGSTFSMDNESSASNIDNIVLTRNGGDFVVADESSASSIDEITLQFQGNFEIANEDSLSNVDNITLERNGGDFVVADETSASSIENIALIGNLKIDDETSASTIDNIALEYQIPETCVVDQEDTEYGGTNSFGALNDVQKLSQTIRPSVTAKICNFQLDLAVIGSPTDNVKLEIYSDDNGSIGSLLGAADNQIAGSELPNYEDYTDIKNFTFADGPQLIAESIYWFVISRTGALDDENLYASVEHASNYSRGTLYIYYQNSWSAIPKDLCFKEYYDNTTVFLNFSIEDESSSSNIENITLGQSGELLPTDESSVSLIDNITLEQNGGTLAVGDITSTPEIENIGLIGNFIIGDVVCETTTEEITLEFEGATFETADISSTSTVENIPLIGELIIQDINAPPTIENIVINSLDISTMNKNVFITQGGLALQTGGLRIPTCISAERPTALKGSLIYNTELNSLEIYDGSNWVTV